MAGSKYYDPSAVVQVIGCIVQNPSLLDNEGQYNFSEIDFVNDFHKVIFGSIYNLHTTGTKNFSPQMIEDYLQNKEKSLAIYRANKGAEWLYKVFTEADSMNFDYYYQRLKKMTLLRTYDDIGMDVSWIYDPDNILDLKKKEEQDQRLDKLNLDEIADLIDEKVIRVREMVVDNSSDESCHIGDELEELLLELEETPAIGYPLFDPATDTVAMGARLRKFYLRSAATGVGKIIAGLKSNL